jgi:hypothetical protein
MVRQVREGRRVMRQSSKLFATFCIKRTRHLECCQFAHCRERNGSVKSIREILQDRNIAKLVDWDLHPFDAVTRYLEWGTNWSRGLDHAKSCNEECVYFKINAVDKPPRLVIVRQSHKDYEIISEVEAPQDLVDESVRFFACKNRACGITEELKSWLKSEASKAA